MKAREDEKKEKYSQLASEIRAIYKVKTECIPIVIGALGTVPKRLLGFLKDLGIPGCYWVHANLRTSRFPAYPKECPEYLKFVVSVACAVVCVGVCFCPLYF